MIEADFTMPKVKDVRVIDINWLGRFIYSSILAKVTVSQISELTGLSERTILKLSNRSVEINKRRWDESQHEGGA
jgi:hypothetical protein